MSCVAVDIGGANLKLSDGRQLACSQPFALWKQPDSLAGQLTKLLAEAGSCDMLAVTMTGELADCFASKSEGVRAIVRAAVTAAGSRAVRVYLTSGELVTPEVAIARPYLAAASNWHALATYAGRLAPEGPSMLLDVGSTTCDLIPLTDGLPVPRGKTDTERLQFGELVYTGVERSPVCAIVQEVPYRERLCPVAQEWFATTRDVYLVTGDVDEAPEDVDTADGRPATVAAAVDRLARMVCADHTAFRFEDAQCLALSVVQAQVGLLRNAWERVTDLKSALPRTVLLSGHGEFLAARLLNDVGADARVISLKQLLGNQQTRCATACALAVLAQELVSHD